MHLNFLKDMAEFFPNLTRKMPAPFGTIDYVVSH
jgi:hypothetical protein